MDKPLYKSIMEPFVQTGQAYTRAHEGTGLGLAICKRLMEMHGGTIEIESEPGIGTTMSIRFPPERTVLPAPSVL